MWDKSTYLSNEKYNRSWIDKKVVKKKKKKFSLEKELSADDAFFFFLIAKKITVGRNSIFFLTTSYFCQCDVEQVPLIKSAVIH